MAPKGWTVISMGTLSIAAWSCNAVLGIQQFAPNDLDGGGGSSDGSSESTGTSSSGSSGSSGSPSGGSSGSSSSGNPSGSSSGSSSEGGDAGCTATSCGPNATCLGGSCMDMFASCTPGGFGMTNCLEASGGTGSCCASNDVTSGSYWRTYTNSGNGATGEADSATVSGFRLDKYLVTVGRFRQFADAVLLPDGGLAWTPPAGSGKHVHLNGSQGLASGPNVDAGQTYEPGWSTSDNSNIAPTNTNLGSCSPNSTWTNTVGSPANQENLPINCVTWQEAYAFCIWDGGFLPSESEWEYAAAAGSQQLEYPWGSAAPGTVCPGTGCEYAIYNCDYPNGNGSGSCAGVTNIAPVGYASLGVAAWGQFDLVGEVYEWNLDWYASSYADPCTDCFQPDSSSLLRALRGGHFFNNASYLLPTYRGFGTPTDRYDDVGFRCARTP